MDGEISAPTRARGLYRLAVLFASFGIFVFILWSTYSTSAALSRISATVRTFQFYDRCDAFGNRVSFGEPNCVDLERYVFVNGPVMKAYRRACQGRDGGPAVIILEAGKSPRGEIHRVDKAFRFRVRNGQNVPCNPPDPTQQK